MPNRGAHLRSRRRTAGSTAEPSGEVPCSGARRRGKAERSERRDSRRRSRLERFASRAPDRAIAWLGVLVQAVVMTREIS